MKNLTSNYHLSHKPFIYKSVHARGIRNIMAEAQYYEDEYFEDYCDDYQAWEDKALSNHKSKKF